MMWTVKRGEKVRHLTPNSRQTRYCVMGAGHGGQAMAADLASRGYAVNLFNKSAERLEPIQAQGGISLSGVLEGFGPMRIVTTDPAEAVIDTDLIMVVVPATAHRNMARMIAPYLVDGQVIVLHPGRTGGALEFSQVLWENGCRADVTVAEAQTFIYASRAGGDGTAQVFGVKNEVPLAALPAANTGHVLSLLADAYPQYKTASSVLETSLNNMGAIFHPALTLLNAARIEAAGDFDYYHDGLTPAVAKVLESMDCERVALARALGVPGQTAIEWLAAAYGAHGATLREAVLNNAGYAGIKAPTNLDHRYLYEDVPMSLVPMASLGRLLGVATPTIDHVIGLACILHNVNYWHEGRTVERLGLTGLSAPQIHALIENGRDAA